MSLREEIAKKLRDWQIAPCNQQPDSDSYMIGANILLSKVAAAVEKAGLSPEETETALRTGMNDWVKISKADSTPQAMVGYGARAAVEVQLQAILKVIKEEKS